MRRSCRLRLTAVLLTLLSLQLIHLAAGGVAPQVQARPLTASCTGASLAVSPSSPQLPGTAVTLTGSATGCTDPSPLFKYWVEAPGSSTWVVVHDWTSGTAAWGTTGLATGTYQFSLWAKDALSTTMTWDVNLWGGYYTLSGVCTGGSLSTGPSSPQPAGTPITLTGAATGCTDPSPLFKYWVEAPGSSTWVLVQDWATGTADWNTLGFTPGYYQFSLWVKDALSTTATWDVNIWGSFTLSVATAPSVVTLTTPSNGATATGTTPAFSWSAPAGSTSGSTTYLLTIWNPYVEPNGSKVGDFNAGTGTTYTPSTGVLAGGTDYEWSVSACNGQACSAYGTWWTFTTSTSSGTVVSQSSPTNGATGQSLTPTLSWGSVTGTTAYKVSIWDPYGVPDGHLMADITVTSGTSVAVPAAEGLFYGQQYYWNVRSCTGSTGPAYSPCGGYNATWYSFTTATMTTPAPGGSTYSPVLNALFVGGVTPPGWSYASGPGANQRTYTAPAVNLDPDVTNVLGLKYALSNTGELAYVECVVDDVWGDCTWETLYEDDGDSVAVYATPAGGSPTMVYCDELDDSDLCSSGPDASTAYIPLSSSLGATVTISIVLDIQVGVYSGPWPTLTAMAQLDGAGVATGPQNGVSGGGGFPKPVSSAAGGVSVTTGIFNLSQTDMTLDGAWPLNFTRSYTSVSPALLYFSAGAWPFGWGWSTNWQAAVTTDSSSNAYVQSPAGSFMFTYYSGAYYAPAGVNATLTYASGVYTLTTVDQTKWAISGTSLTSVTDRFGNSYTLTYTSGMLSKITAPTGRYITVTSSGGLITGLSDNASRTVSYSYSAGSLHTVTDVRGNVWTYSYNSAAQLTQVQDPTSCCTGYSYGNIPVRLTYDSVGRVATFEDGANATLTYTYGSPSAGATTVTDQRSHNWVFYYTPDLEEIAEKDPGGNVVSRTFDVDKNTTLVVTPSGQATSATYDSNGNQLSVVDALGYEVTNTYNGKNNLTSTTNQNGHTAHTDYDSTTGLYLQDTKDYLGNETTYSVDSTTGLVDSVTNANSHTTTNTYDMSSTKFGDLLSVKDQIGNTTSYTYDGVGRKLTMVDPVNGSSHPTSYTYDAAGDVLTVTVPINLPTHSTAVTTSTYDADGRLLSVQDPNGNTTTTTYEPRGLPLTVVDPVNGSGHPTSYAYDAAGNRTTVTDANGSSWTYSYDNDNRLLSVTEPSGGTPALTNTYDTSGRLATSADGKSQTTTYTYDQRSALTKITYAASPGTVTYTFDGVGNRLSMSDSTGTTTYTYDADNELTGVTNPGAAAWATPMTWSATATP